MQQLNGRHDRICRRWRMLAGVVFAIYLSGGVAFGYVAFKQVQSIFAIDLLAGTPSHLSILPPGPKPDPPAQPMRASPPTEPQPENQRVTVLLLGMDLRNGGQLQGGPGRTDTMMLATIEPSTGTAGLLTIPRDLWVTIPATGSSPPRADRINTANFWGDYEKYPGGGPSLAKRTVEYNLGVRVHYYARVNFRGFQTAIDTLGGVDLNVPKPIYDEEYPDDDGDVITIFFQPGRQHMNGARALQYVRTRHMDTDFGRTERQRQVLMALRERMLQLDALPRLPSLLSTLGASIQTDMPLTEILQLANTARSIDSSQIQTRAIDLSMTVPTITSGGADVLLPQREAIARLIGEMFFDPTLKQENTAVEALNGTGTPTPSTRATDMTVALGQNGALP